MQSSLLFHFLLAFSIAADTGRNIICRPIPWRHHIHVFLFFFISDRRVLVYRLTQNASVGCIIPAVGELKVRAAFGRFVLSVSQRGGVAPVRRYWLAWCCLQVFHTAHIHDITVLKIATTTSRTDVLLRLWPSAGTWRYSLVIHVFLLVSKCQLTRSNSIIHLSFFCLNL